MELIHIKGDTWAFRDWQLIPFYKLDDRRCVFLDTGMADQMDALDAALTEHELVPAGIIGSHAHIDHMGSHARFREKYGAVLALSLGEAALLASPLGLNYQYHDFTTDEVASDPLLGPPICLADRIILPHEDEIELCGARFGIVHTPGHTLDHICVRTPDGALYLADAMMTGRTLYRSKFPYAFSMKLYIASMTKLRGERADLYVVAHDGVYRSILPLIDLEIRFLQGRMREILDLVTDAVRTPEDLAAAICAAYRIHPRDHMDLSYFVRASQAYLVYLRELGLVEFVLEDDRGWYRRTARSFEERAVELPEPGLFR